MVRYFYSWTPLAVAGAVVLLALPWLGVIALMVFALVAAAALASTVVFVPYALGRAASGLWHVRTAASPRPATVLSPVGPRPESPATAASIAQVALERDSTAKPRQPSMSLLV